MAIDMITVVCHNAKSDISSSIREHKSNIVEFN